MQASIAYLIFTCQRRELRISFKSWQDRQFSVDDWTSGVAAEAKAPLIYDAGLETFFNILLRKENFGLMSTYSMALK